MKCSLHSTQGRYAVKMRNDAVTPNRLFLAALRPTLSEVALPQEAAAMAAYMKSSMPFLGVSCPTVRKSVRALAKEHPFTGVEQLGATVVQLWAGAEFREERYAAIMLTDSRLARGQMRLLPFYAGVVETGQWWDYVDSVAPRLCELLQAHRDVMDPLLRAWSTHANFWFRRAAIIAQLPAKESTDTGLLHQVIAANLGDTEFFIRKAIGWALRQYAKTDPDWVRDFVTRHGGQLSPLSRREALKHLDG